MRLTKKNYYTTENKYLSNSKIKDFLKDPEYFYKRHVTGEIEFEQTPSMRIGSAVDLYLTGSPAQFSKAYQKKVLKKDEPELFELQKTADPNSLLSESEWDKVHDIVNRVKKLSVYKDIKKNFKAQKIFKTDIDLGLFDGICGIPDWYSIVEDKAIIVDLKTATSVAEGKFKWAAIDYGYYIQQAIYQMLVKDFAPHVKQYESYILAVENSGPHYQVNLFKMDQEQINFTKMEVTGIIDMISTFKKKDFKPVDIDWDKAIEL